MAELKPCPWCNSMPEVEPANPERGSEAYKQAAIARWNRRAVPPVGERELRELNPVLHSFAEGRISTGKARELIREWLHGKPFSPFPQPEYPQEPGERCESGLPDCGPATGYSLDDVPLCERCGKELAAPDPATEPRAWIDTLEISGRWTVNIRTEGRNPHEPDGESVQIGEYLSPGAALVVAENWAAALGLQVKESR